MAIDIRYQALIAVKKKNNRLEALTSTGNHGHGGRQKGNIGKYVYLRSKTPIKDNRPDTGSLAHTPGFHGRLTLWLS
jgi:hypothetical protein